MKKTFHLKSSELPLPRQLEAIKSEVNKYLKRERRKKLPDDVDFWDFDCRIGLTASESKTVHSAELLKAIGAIIDERVESIYLEILSKPGHRSKRPQSGENM